MKIAFIFKSSPFGSSKIREGLDTLLALSAYCDESEIAVFFLYDGVLNLLQKQRAELILQKDTAAMLKLISLYEINQCFVSQEDLIRYNLLDSELLLPVEKLDQKSFFQKLHQAEKILTF